MLPMAGAIVEVLCDFLNLGGPFFRPASAIRAENLGLRKQLAAYMERGIKPRRFFGEKWLEIRTHRFIAEDNPDH